MTDLNVDADEARFLDLVGAKLGATTRNRFRAAHARPSWLLRDRVLRPNLFRCEPGRDLTECTYYPVALVAETPGRNHELAQRVAAVAKRFSADEAWSQLTYFANALRACAPEWDEASGRDEWQAPSERVVGRHHVFTFEFGVPDIGFLREQMSWLKARKKPSDSPMGRLFARLSGYADFAGLTVSYGGNKSLHIHAAFETRLACETLHLDAVADPRTGFAAHWDLLRPTVREALGVPEGVEPDAHLRCPEAYRRMPNAYRLVEDDGHVLGVPPGTWVRQVTLWEQWRERAAANTTAILFRPDPFHQPPRGDRARRRSSGTSAGPRPINWLASRAGAPRCTRSRSGRRRMVGMSGPGEELERRIRERAYFLWLHEGRPAGRAAEHWLRACEEEAAAAAAPRREAREGRIDAAGEASRGGQLPGERSAVAHRHHRRAARRRALIAAPRARPCLRPRRAPVRQGPPLRA